MNNRPETITGEATFGRFEVLYEGHFDDNNSFVCDCIRDYAILPGKQPDETNAGMIHNALHSAMRQLGEKTGLSSLIEGVVENERAARLSAARTQTAFAAAAAAAAAAAESRLEGFVPAPQQP